ncbi:hypothetical protein HU200_010761 [Digitaria exilis]|uniref:Protein kinase domain-containing protein n=1 Tax=Digitaria exilis TaxID=1010633 RepID=A0A835KNB6_9POAL|nr:hypothetical protein HU200_010761 [Digitaria exilis]
MPKVESMGFLPFAAVATIATLLMLPSSIGGAAPAAAAATGPEGSIINCTTSCGNISIQYPFGIEPGCYHGPGFNLTCRNDAASHAHGHRRLPKLFLGDGTVQVLDISVEDSTVRIRRGVPVQWKRSLHQPNMGARDPGQRPLLPVGVDQHSGGHRVQHSVDKGFDYTMDMLGQDHPQALPATLDWLINNSTCTANKTAPECRSAHSYSQDSSSQLRGYICQCNDGYQGNPYVHGGCQDIDECKFPDRYVCYAICKNKPGNFSCLSIGLGVGGGTSILFLVLGVPFIIRKIKLQKDKKMREKFFNQNHGLLLQQLISHNADVGERMVITLRELEKATNNFDRGRVIGGGGYGVVFKGIIDLKVVAIKKSRILVQREIDEFINEVAVLSQVNHRNVVKLLGCCLETEVPLLVYEFISNGTLYQHLHVEGPISLPWVDRIRIALEVSRALSYLHSSASMPIFHRDIKSTNILLDESLTAKVSDFGASRYIPIDQTEVTTEVQGTRGYLDPMYYYTGRLTDKSDVFSFGVLLIELLTKKQPFVYHSEHGDNLVSHFRKLLAIGNLAGIIDAQVMEEEDGEVLEVAAVAAMCTNLRGEDRPTMRGVELTLESVLVKKKQVPCITIPRRHDEDEISGQHISIELVSIEEGMQYLMKRWILAKQVGSTLWKMRYCCQQAIPNDPFQ